MDPDAVPMTVALALMTTQFLFGLVVGSWIASRAWRDQHYQDQARIKELGWLVTSLCSGAEKSHEADRAEQEANAAKFREWEEFMAIYPNWKKRN